MQDRSSLLKQLFEVGDLQKLQDKISFATDVAMITVDFTGKPISSHSGCSEFCKRIRKDPVLSELCQKCDSRGGLESARLKKPYIYTCHMGLVDFATPVFLQGVYVGSVMAGQIRIKNETNYLERVTNIQNEHNLEGALLSLYKTLPTMSLARIDALSNMIFYLYNYVIKEASEKINNLYVQHQSSFTFPEHKDVSVIKNAINYINENYIKVIRLDHLASLCDISPSYFSKLFKKVMGVNLSSYVNNLRTDKAKFLLAKTNKPIVTIAYDVGFDDCGYFIKIFKKFVGFTPNAYRSNLIENQPVL